MSLGYQVIALICLTLVPARDSDGQPPNDPVPPAVRAGYAIPLIDVASQKDRQTVVDREKGQYLGHPTTVLLEDGNTMIVVSTHGARAGCHRDEAEYGWRDLMVRSPAHARQLGDVERNTDHSSGG